MCEGGIVEPFASVLVTELERGCTRCGYNEKMF
jgi:hypothetical protein